MEIFRALVVAVLAVWKRLKQKQLGVLAGLPPKQVSVHLKNGLSDEIYERMIAGLRARPAHVAVVTACLESLDALDREGDLTAEEQDEVELAVLEGSRLLRQAFADAARQTRELPPLDDYPRPEDVEPCRWLAGEQWQRVKGLPEDQQLAVVRVAGEYQTWAFCERVCEESEEACSQDLDRAASLARLAVAVAERVRGPEGWRLRVRGYARAFAANILRVAGKLPTAEADLAAAKELWQAGADPDRVLDPGRLLDLEASLCRDQRRFAEALALLKEAREVSHCPGRILLKKGATLAVLGEHERAAEALLEAQPLIERMTDPRLLYMLRFNLAVAAVELGRYAEGRFLADQVREVAVERGDENELHRVTWLDGRIAAGQGRTGEALALLEQARRGFADREMWYDVALALVEQACLLLEAGRAGEVKRLARGLAKVFESERVHQEALAALRLFREAAEREEVTAGRARSVLRYLFQSRHDQGLRFTDL